MPYNKVVVIKGFCKLKLGMRPFVRLGHPIVPVAIEFHALRTRSKRAFSAILDCLFSILKKTKKMVFWSQYAASLNKSSKV